MVARIPYHRTCFRCARCNNQLTPGNYYETEEDQYCCEICPDDEISSLTSPMHQKYNEEVVNANKSVNMEEDILGSSSYKRSLSDEEKTSERMFEQSKTSSSPCESERKLEFDSSGSLHRGRSHEFQDTTIPDLIAQTSQMRLNFITNHLLSEWEDERSTVDDAAEGNVNASEVLPSVGYRQNEANRISSAFPDDNERDVEVDDDEEKEEEKEEDEEEDEENEEQGEKIVRVEERNREEEDKERAKIEENKAENKEEAASTSLSIKFGNQVRILTNDAGGESPPKDNVHYAIENSLDTNEDAKQQLTAISSHDTIKVKPSILDNIKDDTKELLGKVDESDDTEKSLSLVQKRLKMFEMHERQDYIGARKQMKSAKEISLREQNSETSTSDNLISRPVFLDNQKISNASKFPIRDKSVFVKGNITNNSKINSTDKDAGNISRNLGSIEGATPRTCNDSVPIERKQDHPSNETTSSKEENTSLLESSRSTTLDKVSENLEKSGNNSLVESIENTSLTTAEGIDLSHNEDYPESLNPFKSDDDEDTESKKHMVVNTPKNSRISTNPFDSDDDEHTDEVTTKEKEIWSPKPAARTIISKGKDEYHSSTGLPTRRRLAAPQINLNPFGSDEDDGHDSDLDQKKVTVSGIAPVPKPRTIKHTPELGLSQHNLDLSRGGVYASNSSIASSESTVTPGGTYRKKKPAPPPPSPAVNELDPLDERGSPVQKSHNSSMGYPSLSPRSTPKSRKNKPAPPPPMPTSTLYNMTFGASFNLAESPIAELQTAENLSSHVWQDEKTSKDETNRNRQSLTNMLVGESLGYKSNSSKSLQGKWKRKKGPAPPRPIPHRRKIKVMSMKDVKLELDEIELQQQGLERQGVRLEQLIRDKCESGSKAEDTSLSMDVEELVLELFALVNEKNELFRRQAELMLLRRQQRLEEEHAEMEYQIRCLMSQPEATKTDFDKQREESLIQRLVEIVERRNEIVECLEMDRRREMEEDRSIHKHMGLYAARNKNEVPSNNNDSMTSKAKKGKTKEKVVKDKKGKKTTKKDADKDVDETEVKLKGHTKRKWF